MHIAAIMLSVPDGDANEVVHTIDTGAGDAGTSADVLDGNYKVRYSAVVAIDFHY